jgi:hypothetical protein
MLVIGGRTGYPHGDGAAAPDISHESFNQPARQRI